MNDYPDTVSPLCYSCDKALPTDFNELNEMVCYDDLNNLVWECHECHRKHQQDDGLHL